MWWQREDGVVYGAAVLEHLKDVVSGVWGWDGELGPFLAVLSFGPVLLAGCCCCLAFCCPWSLVLMAWGIRISWVMRTLWAGSGVDVGFVCLELLPPLPCCGRGL